MWFFAGILTGFDPDGDSLTYSLVVDGTLGTVVITDPATGAYTYTPNADLNGSDSFTFVVSDGQATSAEATVLVSIDPQNDAPIATGKSIAATEDVLLNDNLLASDVDADALTYNLVADAAYGTVTVNTDGSYSYTASVDYSGADSFSFKVSDGTVDSNVASVNINVSAINDAPTSNDGNLVVNENAAASDTMPGNDVDGDPLLFSIVTSAINGTVVIDNAATGAYTYTPGAGFVGNDSFSFKVNDGTVDSNISTISISVVNVNDAPTATSASIVTAEDTVSGGVTPSVTDADTGDTHTFTIETQSSNGAAAVVDNQLVYTPNADFNGSDSLTYRATDAGGLFVDGSATVTVTAVNDAPVGADTNVSSAEDTIVDSSLTATDVDGDTLTYSIITVPTHGVVTIDSAFGTYNYTPDTDYAGSDSFTFKVNDGTVDSNVGTVSLTISAVNDVPVITGQLFLETEAETALTVALSDLTVVDPDNSYPGDFTLSILDGTNYSHAVSTITPDAAFTGQLQVPVTVNDGLADSAQFMLSITVTAAPSNPLTATLDKNSIGASENAEINLMINDLAVAGGSVSVEQIADLDADGVVDSGEPVIRRLQLIDTDADGSISTTLNMLNTLAVDHAAGSYLLRVSDGSDTLITPFVVDPVSEPQTLQGQITDGVNGIAGVQVQLIDKWQRPVAWAITDGNGDYLFQVPEAGGYYLLPQAEGYAFDRNTAALITVVASAPTTTPDVKMIAGANTISGQVSSGAAELVGIRVVATGSLGNGYFASTLTDNDGGYSLSLPAGDYTIQVVADSYAGPSTYGCPADATTDVVLSVNGDQAGVDFSLPMSAVTVSGVVADETTMPIAGESVVAISNDEVIAMVVTATDGSYSLPLAENSSYTVTVEPDFATVLGYVGQQFVVQTATSDVSGQNLPIHSIASWITGTITDESSSPLTVMPVHLRSGDDLYHLSTNTTVDGGYLFGAFAGTWFVRAETESQGFTAATESEIALLSGQTGQVDFIAASSGGDESCNVCHSVLTESTTCLDCHALPLSQHHGEALSPPWNFVCGDCHNFFGDSIYPTIEQCAACHVSLDPEKPTIEVIHHNLSAPPAP